MSRRYALFAAKEKVEETFDVDCPDQGMFEPNFNVAQGATVPVVLLGKARMKMVGHLQWGLKVDVTDDEMAASIPKETLADHARLKRMFQRQRCIVPVSGFYEWQKMGKLSIPYYIRVLDQEVMGLGGIYEKEETEGGQRIRFALLTTESNDLLNPLQPQMPVILRRSDYEDWLDPLYEDLSRLQGLLKPYPTERMALYRVGNDVDDLSNNGPDLVRPVV